ncbi:metallophosphoesterase [candidate division WOR-3 bacterium JGI_Cruoil_03_44_89]|uniref:Metallophosphoesterase n=1 Tax=candidate division WOR-3 bacterium JGI_Cruoil_03_44_89 TaxID=1973748 RepID=A0A235BPX9_UNCW3|nr:MAG: metallophosphoesterase [candidate division WOR-3 bacterium JGI_Cruoil_03_44_89]
MKILFIGDIYGRPGRMVCSTAIPFLKDKYHVDFVIANGENAAGGFGLTPMVVGELKSLGIDCITTGNHIWDKKEIIPYLKEGNRDVLRPLNYPEGVPAVGSHMYGKIGVINLLGRTFVNSIIDCPFRNGLKEAVDMRKKTKTIVVDFHAETTAEKQAFAFWIDGKVSAVVGTHTHVQTSDERILPGGTAFITDAGMTGAFDSVIGARPKEAIERFLYGIPKRLQSAKGGKRFNGVLIDIDEETGTATSIERLNFPVE